jgi:ABC-type uncharacterized transport system
MMNRKIFFIALVALVLPLLLRFIWFFPGLTFPHHVATPDYGSLKLPEAPVSTPQAEQLKQAPGVVVLDYSHTNQFQPNEIQTLMDALSKEGGLIELNSDPTLLESQLKKAAAYVVISPSTSFSEDEIRIIHDFVGRGGRMLVFTDPTRGQQIYDLGGSPIGTTPDTNFVNPLLEPYGITANGDYLYNLVENEGNFRNVYFDSLNSSDLTQGLKKVVLYGTNSIETTTGMTLLAGNDKTFSSLTDSTPSNDTKNGWAAAALSREGNVLAIGDFTFLAPPYDTVADNAVFITNITNFLLGGRRRFLLSDFPYLFNGTSVDILPTSNVQMTAELTGALSRLQSSFNTINIGIAVVQKATPGQNLIVLGTFSPSNDLKTYTDQFNITLDDFSEFVEIPAFGKVGRSGNGLLLFSEGKTNNTLVLLADSVSDLTALMDTLSSGTLSGCILQANLAVCSIGAGGSFSEGTPTPAPALNPGTKSPGPTPGG